MVNLGEVEAEIKFGNPATTFFQNEVLRVSWGPARFVSRVHATSGSALAPSSYFFFVGNWGRPELNLNHNAGQEKSWRLIARTLLFTNHKLIQGKAQANFYAH